MLSNIYSRLLKRKALEGILMQEVDFNYEILLRDDTSFDGKSEICKDFAKN